MSRANRLQVIATGLTLAVIVVPSAIAQQRYPEPQRSQYINNCTGNFGPEVRATCECIVRKSEEKYSFAQFQDINTKLSKNQPVLPEFTEIVKACGQNPNY